MSKKDKRIAELEAEVAQLKLTLSLALIAASRPDLVIHPDPLFVTSENPTQIIF
jgi:hypothetical protein